MRIWCSDRVIYEISSSVESLLSLCGSSLLIVTHLQPIPPPKHTHPQAEEAAARAVAPPGVPPGAKLCCTAFLYYHHTLLCALKDFCALIKHFFNSVHVVSNHTIFLLP